MWVVRSSMIVDGSLPAHRRKRVRAMSEKENVK